MRIKQKKKKLLEFFIHSQLIYKGTYENTTQFIFKSKKKNSTFYIL